MATTWSGKARLKNQLLDMKPRSLRIVLYSLWVGACVYLYYQIVGMNMDDHSQALLTSSEQAWQEAVKTREKAVERRENERERDCVKGAARYGHLIDEKFFSEETAVKIFELCLKR